MHEYEGLKKIEKYLDNIFFFCIVFILNAFIAISPSPANHLVSKLIHISPLHLL